MGKVRGRRNGRRIKYGERCIDEASGPSVELLKTHCNMGMGLQHKKEKSIYSATH